MHDYEEGLPSEGEEEVFSAASGAASQVVDAVPIGPYMATVTLHRRPGGWLACATIESGVGRLRWCGIAREQEVADRLARQHQGAAASGNIGNFFRNLGQTIQRGTQQLARNRALRNTVRDIRQTLDRPELQPVLAVAQQIPYLGQAVGAFRAATTIVDDVLGGNPQTRDRLVRIRRAAQQGNPVAREAMSVIETVLQSQQRVTRQRAGAHRGSQRSRRPPHRGRQPRRRGGQPQRRPSRGRPSRGRRGGVPRPAPSRREQHAWQRARQQWAQRQHVAGVGPAVIVPPAPRT